MPWALKRRVLIIGSVLAVVAAVIALTIIATAYEAPTCSDGKQNQDEDGIDCGGSCRYLCAALQAEPVIVFARTLSPVPGRTDVIALVENRNGRVAAQGARFTIELYDRANALVATQTGTTDLPPLSRVPVFVPNAYRGEADIARAFIAFDDASLRWFPYTDVRPVPRVVRQEVAESPLPRVSATLKNTSASTLYNVLVVATVFDSGSTVIAASQTVIPIFAPQGEANAIFTWNAPWSAPYARIEFTPVIPL